MSDHAKKIIESIARKLSEEDIKYMQQHRELPAVKLTEEEMNFLKGGGWLDDLWNDFVEDVKSLKRAYDSIFPG